MKVLHFDSLRRLLPFLLFTICCNFIFAAEQKIHVQIFSGQNNQNSRATTPKLKSILETSGRFTVDVTEHPEASDAATLEKYDVLLSNWNTFGKTMVTNWPPVMRAAFLDFVRSGKGFVSVHAGSSSFYDWPEYPQLAGGAWKFGPTGHGPPHEFAVKIITTNQPITCGLSIFFHDRRVVASHDFTSEH